jgi:ABC-type dipeptide/oligopeptide/nickel transport system permease component
VVEGVLLLGALFVVVVGSVLEFAGALADPRIRRS